MTTATKTTPTAKGFGSMACPKCHEPEATVSLYLLAAEETEFYCHECNDSFTVADIEEMVASVAKWAKVLSWVGTMPAAD